VDRSRIGPTPAVTQFVRMLLLDNTGDAVPGAAELHYEPTDPYAVTVTFLTEQGEVDWTFGRDLLIDGSYRPFGDGDVHVQPSVDSEGRALVLLELHSRSSVAVVQTGASDMRAFVDRMIGAVPIGDEAEYLDLDASLEALLVPDCGE
jgi:hypothetical protein